MRNEAPETARLPRHDPLTGHAAAGVGGELDRVRHPAELADLRHDRLPRVERELQHRHRRPVNGLLHGCLLEVLLVRSAHSCPGAYAVTACRVWSLTGGAPAGTPGPAR